MLKNGGAYVWKYSQIGFASTYTIVNDEDSPPQYNSQLKEIELMDRHSLLPTFFTSIFLGDTSPKASLSINSVL